LNPRLDRGLADFDAPHRLVISGIWELPFDRGFENKVAKFLSQGWQFNAIATFQAGNPFTVYSNNNSSQQDQNPDLSRPDLIGPRQYLNPRQQTQAFSAGTATCLGNDVLSGGHFWFNPNAFNCTGPFNNDGTINPAGVPLFTFGTTPRNFLRGPGIDNFDLSIVKKTHIGEGAKSVEFRTEFFNALNHTQFSNPDNAGGSGTFGQVTSTRIDNRIIQFGLKFYF
jgi:hypothetical protein